jgi:hypothetical protein
MHNEIAKNCKVFQLELLTNILMLKNMMFKQYTYINPQLPRFE